MLALCFLGLGCSGGSETSANVAATGGPVASPSTGDPTPGPSGSPPASATPSPSESPYAMYPLAWENRVPGSQQWSQYVFDIVLNQAPSLMAGSGDVTNFCPRYASMDNNQKANFWAYLISEVASFESGDDPTDRYVESGLGIDPITGQQVVSEGLLQLSYQDKLNYPFCRFDWAHDSQMAAADPGKTILDPLINLQCGTLILNTQIKNHNLIVISSGAYWSTLKSGSPYNKISQIEAATQSLPFCSGP